MGLDVPDLDDRRYEELVTDARKRIPVHSERWTDHNPSDPGITILELLAWIAESDIYQLDRVTERHVRKYLRLLGVRPRPPQPSTASLDLTPGSVAGTVLPAGVGLAATAGGDRRRFETADSVALTAASVAAVISETGGGRVDNTRANARDGLHYRPFGAAGPDDAVYLGFDADPFAAVDRLDLFVDFYEGDLASPASHGDEPVDFEPSASVVWEHCTDLSRRFDPEVWHEVPVRVDETTHLYGGGTVSLAAPSGWTGARRALFGVDEPRIWLRARVETPHHEIPPRVNEIVTNVVEAVDRVRYRDQRLARVEEGVSVAATRAEFDEGTTTTARPAQEFVFPHAPVLGATVTVGGTEWTAVPDLDAAGPDEEQYVLEAERGVVRFGDGVRGEVPAPDQVVRATWYDRGGGEAGNVPGDADWQFVDPALSDSSISPRGPATGGTATESTDAALARLKADLRTPYRAVTADDFRYVATHTPGLRFGRAAVHVEPRGSPEGDCARHGHVTVTVVPESTRDRPVPSPGFLDAVQCHLERHRLLTDEVTAVAPTYVPVTVEAVVEVAEGYAVDRRLAAAGAALERFLDPLDGFDGGGWPFGRSVYRSEVYETVEGVEGVDCVVDVELSADSPGTRTDTGIDVPGSALVYLADATVIATQGGDRCGEWSR